ncbi:hypothetical protein AB6A40_002438 [Gnathostoma spinigerum]|uniref:Uncharacterized protein n=1 Tax=Gnathostoma spinigerum TaxID=75299 RepID=A0ABD6EC55_9BILA
MDVFCSILVPSGPEKLCTEADWNSWGSWSSIFCTKATDKLPSELPRSRWRLRECELKPPGCTSIVPLMCQ